MDMIFTEEQTELLNMLAGFRFHVEYNQAERYIIIDDPHLIVLTLDVSKPAFGYHNDDEEGLLSGIGFHIGYPMVVSRYDDGERFSVKALFRRGVDIVDFFDDLGCIRLQSADHDPIYLRQNTEILFDECEDSLQKLHASDWDEIKSIFLPNTEFTSMAYIKANARNLEDIIEDMDPANWWKHNNTDNNADDDTDDDIDDEDDLI